MIPVDKKRKAELFLHLLRTQRWKQVLVFAKTRNGVDELVDKLQGLGINADGIHGDKPQATRQRALDRFKASEVQILVATDVAARGLDIDDLPLVVNFNLNAKDVGKTRTDGTISVTLLTLGQNYAEVDIVNSEADTVSLTR